MIIVFQPRSCNRLTSSKLMSRFTISVVDPTHPWDSLAYGIFVTNHLWLRLEESQEVGLPN